MEVILEIIVEGIINMTSNIWHDEAGDIAVIMDNNIAGDVVQADNLATRLKSSNKQVRRKAWKQVKKALKGNINATT